MYETGSGAVSRHKVGRSHILVQVEDLIWDHLERCPGLTLIRDLSYMQERFAKTVTNNLPLLSVLGNVFLFSFNLS